MKLKIHLLTILLMMLLIPMSYAQTLPELQNNQSSDYGIELEKFYPGTIVLELMQAAEAEIEAAVNEAYAEGYKAALLQYLPELAGLRISENAMRIKLENERKKNKIFWLSSGASFILGMGLQFIITR